MSLKYLVGPVTAERAECWRPFRDQGDCLCFNATGDADLTFRPSDG